VTTTGSWAEMRESIEARLLRQTGHGVTEQMLLVMERFGYPEFLLASADELLHGLLTSVEWPQTAAGFPRPARPAACIAPAGAGRTGPG
jgi:hypothetical protein